MARSQQYELPVSGKKPRTDDPRGLEPYIREAAKRNGIDPDIAVKVAKSEGLRDFLGDNGKSGGAFQLYTGGGLGNKFQKATGLDPLDPKNEKATIDYAMQQAAQGGWGPWYGAAKVGVGKWDGISGADPEKTAATAAGATPVSEGGPAVTSAAAAAEAPQTTAEGATGGFLDKLKNPKTGAAEGLGEAISGLGQAVTGASKDPYATASARATPPAPPAMPAPAMVPLVDPRAAESQRQQLAMAMQRLNSGRLY
jgi:hypothetical protein